MQFVFVSNPLLQALAATAAAAEAAAAEAATAAQAAAATAKAAEATAAKAALKAANAAKAAAEVKAAASGFFELQLGMDVFLIANLFFLLHCFFSDCSKTVSGKINKRRRIVAKSQDILGI